MTTRLFINGRGTSYRQIVEFRKHFSPELIQLVENRRCPPEIVEAANLLITHNLDRTPDKTALVPTRPDNGPAISLRVFATDMEEASKVAEEIATAPPDTWGKTATFGRTRAILLPVLEAFRARSVKAEIATRRDRFISAQFVWLQTCLDQSLRPADRQVFTAMANAADRVAGTEFDAALLATEAEAAGRSYLEQWALALNGSKKPNAKKLADFALRLIQSRAAWRKVLAEALVWLPETAGTGEGVVTDAAEDKEAWVIAARAIRSEKGSEIDLAELLQGIALRPKEPPANPSAVSLLTVHAAKGLEFDHVWLIGLAETVLPSWQSLPADSQPAQLEEERRICFVAITRTMACM